MFIENLIDFINLLKNQGQARYFNPDEIISALNRSQLDLFREYYKLFEDTREISDSLIPFKESIDYTPPTSSETLPSNYIHLINFSAIIGGQEYPGKIVSDEHWSSRELSNIQQQFGDNIEPFKHAVALSLVNGVANLPDDYVAYIEADAMKAGEYQSEVDITNEHQFVRRKNDKTYPPSEDYVYGWIGGNKITIVPETITEVMFYYYRFPVNTRPIAKLKGRTIKFKPITGIDTIQVDYLRIPVDAVYGYTIVNDRDIVFDSGTSTDIEWYSTDHTALILKTLQYLGISLKDQMLVQFEQIKQDVKPEIVR
jgi:hypothetical protein